MKIKNIILPILPILLATAPAHAAVLANYNFDSGTASTVTEAGSTPGAFSFNDGGDEGSLSADIGTGTNAFIRSDATGSTEALALADDDYFFFTVTADVGQTLNLTSLVFDFGASTQTNGNFAYNLTTYIQSSVGGLGSSDPSLASRSFTRPGNSTGSLTTVTAIDLTGASFQGLNSITFEFSVGDDLNNTNSIARFDNFALEGSVAAIPEPSSTALLGLGGLALILRRRR
jgi:hypothetical protein